jgi:phospholipase/carboxylesterase
MPWWRDPWVTGAGVALGGLAVGGLLGRLTYRVKHGPALFAKCDAVTPSGGVVAGVTYYEEMRGGARPDEKVPMVIAFHSLCSNPRNVLGMYQNIGPSRLIVPAGAFECRTAATHRKWWELGVKAAMNGGDLPGATLQWRAESDRMANFISQIQRCRPTRGKPVVTGSSMGGEMTLLMASTHPELVDSGVAVSSYLLPPFWNRRMAPVAMVHGEGDTTVPFTWAKEYADTMLAAGAPLSFAAFPSDGHNVTKDMGEAWGAGLKGQVARLNGETSALA